MATEHGEYFDEMLEEIRLERTGKPVSEYMRYFPEPDYSQIPSQLGDREPSDAELF